MRLYDFYSSCIGISNLQWNHFLWKMSLHLLKYGFQVLFTPLTRRPNNGNYVTDVCLREMLIFNMTRAVSLWR